MTCIIVYFRNPEDVEKEKAEKASSLSSKEESK